MLGRPGGEGSRRERPHRLADKPGQGIMLYSDSSSDSSVSSSDSSDSSKSDSSALSVMMSMSESSAHEL